MSATLRVLLLGATETVQDGSEGGEGIHLIPAIVTQVAAHFSFETTEGGPGANKSLNTGWWRVDVCCRPQHCEPFTLELLVHTDLIRVSWKSRTSHAPV